MSLVKYLIEMQYQNSMQCAEDLEIIAGNVRSVSTSDLNDMFGEISKAWKGEPAATCLGKMVIPSLHSTANSTSMICGYSRVE